MFLIVFATIPLEDPEPSCKILFGVNLLLHAMPPEHETTYRHTMTYIQ